jgi:hypothetical protein
MKSAERLIDQIVGASRIPSEKRRREVVRELRAHLEDLVDAEGRSGRGEEDTERLLLERFGDSGQIARQFAWVYRRERATLHFGVFLLSTVVVSLLIAAAAIPLQAGVMFGFGAPAAIIFDSRHTAAVALDILASAGTYLALLSLGRFVRQPLTVLAVVVAALLGIFVTAGLRPQFILFGFTNGALLRGIELRFRHPALRLSAALVCFGLLGTLLFHPSSSALFSTSASWLVMGSAYHLMTHIAVRVDEVLLERL